MRGIIRSAIGVAFVSVDSVGLVALPAVVTVIAVGAAAVAAQETTVVVADGPPIWGSSPALVEEARIGTLMGEAEYAFGRVGGLVVAGDGTIWVSDIQLGAVRRYTADGVFIDQIGRKGEGPGEFETPVNMRVLPDASVVVWDYGLIRVTRFDASGAYVDSFTPPTHMIAWDIEELEVDPRGDLFLMGSNLPERTPEGPFRLRPFWIRMRSDGEVLDSVRLLPSSLDGTVDPIRTFTVLSPLGYLVTARNDEYAVELHVDPERTVRIERPWTPVRYQRAERVEKQRREETFSARNGRPVRDIPREKPPFSFLHVDSEGRVWVLMHAPGYEEEESPGEQERREGACEFFAATEAECNANIEWWREPVAYEVIEPEGRLLGRVELPSRQTELMHARERRLWVVETGELGEEYVVRYRIEPGG